jgi:hypothetical protein
MQFALPFRSLSRCLKMQIALFDAVYCLPSASWLNTVSSVRLLETLSFEIAVELHDAFRSAIPQLVELFKNADFQVRLKVQSTFSELAKYGKPSLTIKKLLI